MKKNRTIAICAMIFFLACAGWYFYRWGNYAHRPLFYNFYGLNRDGIGPWHWQNEPGPEFDGSGRAFLFDFEINMVAIVEVGASPSPFVLQGAGASEREYRVILNKRTIAISSSPNAIVQATESGVSSVRTLAPGEARRIWHLIKQAPHDRDDLKHRKQLIDNYLQPER